LFRAKTYEADMVFSRIALFFLSMFGQAKAGYFHFAIEILD